VEISVENKNRDKHRCQAIVIACMDFRFQSSLAEALTKIGLESYDLVLLPGGGKALIDEVGRDLVLGAIDISQSKHHCNTVVVVNHVDCGAYGGSETLGTPEEEENFQTGQIKEALEAIKSRPEFSSLDRIGIYLDWQSAKVV